MRRDRGPDNSRMANITCRRRTQKSGTSVSLTPAGPDSAGEAWKDDERHLLKVRLSVRGEEGGQDLGVEGELRGGRDAAHL